MTAPVRVIEVMAWHSAVPGRYPPDPGSLDWRQSGACVSMNPDDLFPAAGSPDEARVLAACAACLVRRQCLGFALEHRIADGIWGGMAEGELRVVLGTSRTASPLCPSGRHLLADVGLTSDGRCRACRRETWREQDRASGSGLGHGRYIRTENPQSNRRLAA